VQFIDEKASLVDAFYTRLQGDDQLGKLSEHTVKDFFAPSFLAMPWPLTPQLIERAAELAAEGAKPISDQRGSADFRRHLVRVLTRRTLTIALARAGA